MERFLKDESIRAKRPSLLQRARKWARRHQGVVRTALASVALLLLTVAIGASLAAWRLSKEQKATRDQLFLTQEAKSEGKSRHYRSLVVKAQASRLSRRIGQRFETLEALTEAAQMARAMNLPEEDLLELRNVAIACLALPDLRVAREWPGWPAGSVHVDFDPTLERYARVDREGVVHLHRAADGDEICPFDGLGKGDSWPLFSPDRRFLALGHQDHRLKVWDLADPRLPVVLKELAAPQGAAFSPDGRRLAVGLEDNSIHLFDLPSGQELTTLGAGPPARGMAFHPKKQQLAVSCATGVQVRDLESGAVLANFPEPTGAYWVAWGPDGQTVAAACGDQSIRIWDVVAGKPTVRLEGHRQNGIQFAFNHAGDSIVSTCWDGTLRLWDPQTGQMVFSTPASLQSPRFSPDDHLLAGGDDETKLKVWEVTPSCGYRTVVRDPVLGRGEYHGCATSPRDDLLAVGMLDGVGLWDLAGGKPLAFLRIGRNTEVLFEPSGALLTSGQFGLLRWPVRRDAAESGSVRIGPPQKLPLPPSPMEKFSTSRDGRVLAMAEGWGGLVWNQDLPEPPIQLTPHEDTRNIAVSADGAWVATGSHWGTKVKIWDARTGKSPHELPVEGGSGVRFSPDGRWLATTGGGGCRLWAVDSWQEGAHVGGGLPAFYSSPNGTVKLLAVETGYGVVRLVNPDTGREYARLEDPNQERAGQLTFSADGAQLVTTSLDSHSVHVWDLRSIRGELAKMELDWDLPPYPPAPEVNKRQPLRIEVDLGDLTPVMRDPIEFTQQLIEQARRALEAKPKSPRACNDLAWTYLTAPEALRDWKAALPLAQKAVQLEPSPMHRNTLGLAYYRAGRYRESVEVLQANLKDQEAWALTYDLYFLAMSHHQLGDSATARQFYDLAVRWSATHTEALAQFVVELAAFRAEAAGLLEVKEKKE